MKKRNKEKRIRMEEREREKVRIKKMITAPTSRKAAPRSYHLRSSNYGDVTKTNAVIHVTRLNNQRIFPD